MTRFFLLLPTLFILSLLALAACQPWRRSDPALDPQLRDLIARAQLTGDPSRGRETPDIKDPLVQLGMMLFFTKALSGDMDTACASCHHPLLGGGDGLALSIGVGAERPDRLGPGRSHPEGTLVPRNAPTTFNAALWDEVMFWDGRIESLGKTPGRNGADGQGIRTPDSRYNVADPRAGPDLPSAQSRFPLTAEIEMRGERFEAHRFNARVREHLSARLGDYGRGRGELTQNGWLQMFQEAFASELAAEDLITEQSIAAAIGAYERSQVFVNTPWRAYVQGDPGAISVSAKRGALLFFRTVAEGGAGCAACHQGDFFTDKQFHVLAIPQVGPGKGDGRYGDDDFGRFRETGRPEDLYAFRTPSLLNVEVTGPYGHDGAYTTLLGIIKHHLDPAQALARYDAAQLGPGISVAHMAENTGRALAQLQHLRGRGLSALEDVSLTDRQVLDLRNFLLTLTDPCVKDAECLSPWVPDESMVDPDGLRLHAEILARLRLRPTRE